MIFLTVDEIISLHSKLILKTGGIDGIRDKELLESAVYSVYNSFDNIELYPTVKEKSARLAYSIVNNHAFLDGNKRIGILVMLMTLRLNDILIEYTQQELIFLGLSIASSQASYDDVLMWLDIKIK